MGWITAVIIGQFLNALSFVLDKVLLTKSIKNAYAFTFYIGLLGLLIVIAIPFVDFQVPEMSLLLIDLIAGAAFSLALLFFFFALQGAETSRVVPFIGGGIPVFTLVFELLFLDFQLNSTQLLAFAVLVFGTVIIALDDKKDGGKTESHSHLSMKMIWVCAVLAALSFAISFGTTKIAFNTQPFFSAFIWSRIGAFALPAVFLFSKNLRSEIVKAARIFREKSGLLYLGAQGFGAAGFVFVNYAISLASVSLVNAMQGVQYAFLLIMAVIGTLKYPNLLKESMSKRGLVMKIIATVIIGIGLYLVAITL